MSKTVLVPTDGAWNQAPAVMPKPGQWVLILHNTYPQIGFANPGEFSGWAIIHCKKKAVHFDVVADFEAEVFWSPLTAIDELRLLRGDAA